MSHRSVPWALLLAAIALVVAIGAAAFTLLPKPEVRPTIAAPVPGNAPTGSGSLEILPCGDPLITETRAGEVRHAVCSKGHAWMWAQGRWFDRSKIP